MTFISFKKLYTLYGKILFEFLPMAWEVSFLIKLPTLFEMDLHEIYQGDSEDLCDIFITRKYHFADTS